jgi:hypothetical protein
VISQRVLIEIKRLEDLPERAAKGIEEYFRPVKECLVARQGSVVV